MRKYRVRATVVLAIEQEWLYDIYANDSDEALRNIKDLNFANVVDKRRLWDTISNVDEEILDISLSDIEEVIE